jgi:putative membrane protein
MDESEDPRVRFAAERTLLAWVRTGLALMGFGFVVARFGLFLRGLALAAHQATPPHAPGWSLWIGIALVVLGVAVTLLGAAEHWRILKRLNRGDVYLPPKWSLGLVVALALAAIGLAMTAYLVVVGQ